jgi:hypothetical protein
MPIIAKAGGQNFVPCPEGTHAAVCVDIVDLGDVKVSFGGKEKTQHKIRLVWQIDELMQNNKPYIASKRYTLSLHEKAALRKDLESWRGRAFTDAELEGFDVETVLHAPGLINVMHTKKDGDTWANVTAIMKLLKGMEAPQARDYVRVCDRTEDNAQDSQPFPTDLDDVPF